MRRPGHPACPGPTQISWNMFEIRLGLAPPRHTRRRLLAVCTLTFLGLLSTPNVRAEPTTPPSQFEGWSEVRMLDDGLGFAVGGPQLLRTTNAGHTWKTLSPPVQGRWSVLDYPSRGGAWGCEQGRGREPWTSTVDTRGDIPVYTNTSPPARCFSTGDRFDSWRVNDIPGTGAVDVNIGGYSSHADTAIDALAAAGAEKAWILISTTVESAGGGQESFTHSDFRLLLTVDGG